MRNRKHSKIESARPSATLKRGPRTICLLSLALATAMMSAGQDEPTPEAVKFKTLVNFNGANGSLYQGAGLYPTQGTDGNLYGTTLCGGVNTGAQCGFGSALGPGSFFKMTPGGKLTTRYSFCAQANCADGEDPEIDGRVILGTDGNFYGATLNGGAYGLGTIFRITPAGALTTLYAFCPDQPNCAGGDTNFDGVVEGVDGNFYGVSPGGGTGGCGTGVILAGCGTVYKITPAGAFTEIYSFCSQANCVDGSGPSSSLLAAADGELYGITAYGGANGAGTIFKITVSGKLTTLYSFPAGLSPCPSDYTPDCGPLIQASDGNIYGAGTYGGANGGAGGLPGGGSFFKLTPGGTFSTVYNFCSQPSCADGSNPIGLVQGSDGNFYGATYLGGTQSPTCFGSSCGTIFRITSSGALKTLHSFSGADGTFPTGVVQATNGAFYGTASSGGANADGTVFTLSVGLGPFVELLPGSGKVGATVQILGTNLTGATAVSFNGVAAAFTVESKTLISATVPTGATSGFVTVTTPSGTLQSDVKFHVRP